MFYTVQNTRIRVRTTLGLESEMIAAVGNIDVLTKLRFWYRVTVILTLGGWISITFGAVIVHSDMFIGV